MVFLHAQFAVAIVKGDLITEKIPSEMDVASRYELLTLLVLMLRKLLSKRTFMPIQTRSSKDK